VILPGKGCGGIAAIMTGVLIPVRSQWRQAYLNRTFCNTFALTSMYLGPVARTSLLIVGQVYRHTRAAVFPRVCAQGPDIFQFF
jgi:hypothetical protein